MAAKRCVFMLVSLAALAATGCGERPFAEYGLADPWSRKSWAEDEKYGPTYYTKRNELRAKRKSMGWMKPEERERVAIELAERLREEKHPVLRTEIIRALAMVKSDIALESLRAAATDADPDVRVVACEALGERGDPAACQALAQVLGSDTDPDVRLAATRELGKFKNDREAMQALRLALDENNPALQFRAVQSLKDMTGKDYGADMIAWKEFVDGGNPPDPPPATIAERLKKWY